MLKKEEELKLKRVARVMPFFYSDEIEKYQWVNRHYDGVQVEMLVDFIEYRRRIQGIPHQFLFDLGRPSRKYPSAIQYACC